MAPEIEGTARQKLFCEKCNTISLVRKGFMRYLLGHLIVLYILKKNREIYENKFWVRNDYVLFRLYSGEKRDNSAIMLDSFYCYYVQFIIALVEQDHLLK